MDCEATRLEAQDQVSESAGMSPRKKWMKKEELRAFLRVSVKLKGSECSSKEEKAHLFTRMLTAHW